MPFMRKNIVTALNQILQNAKLGEYSLREEINEAIKAVYEAHKQGVKQGESLDIYYKQIDIFTGEANIKSRTVELLSDLLNAEKVKELKKVLISYNEQAVASVGGEIDMFGNGGVKTKEQILEEIIKGVKDYEQRNRTKQSDNVSVSSKDKSDNGGESESNKRTSQAESDRGDKQEEVKLFDRTIPKDKEESKQRITELVKISKQVKNEVERVVIGGVTEEQVKDLKEQGFDIDSTWVHSMENSAIQHNQKQHGNEEKEVTHNQIAITDKDYELAIDILEDYDSVEKSPNKDKQGRDVIIYTKEFSDGTIYYLEEVREKRKSLSFKTMYKRKKGSNTSDGFMQKIPTLTSETASDTLTSTGKVTTNSLYAEESSKKNVGEPKELVNRIRISNCHVGGRVLFGDKGGTFLGSIDIRNKISELLKSEGAELNDGEWHIFNTQSPTGKPVTVIFHNSTIKQLIII